MQMPITSEWELIKKINQLISENSVSGDQLIKGIGDDCAIFKTYSDRKSLITTDISIDGVHFLSKKILPKDIGYKAMTGNISDIAAMGGIPRYAFISLGIPHTFDTEYILNIYRGFLEASNPAGVTIAGGDTSRANQLFISITIYGDSPKPVTRAGANIDDYVYVTGELGGAEAGLDLLISDSKNFPELLKRHLHPTARYNLVNDLISEYNPSSMIDISDGLLSDLNHICNSSNCGFLLFSENIPVMKDVRAFLKQKRSLVSENMTPELFALSSGEEYELLFTSKIHADKKTINNVPVTCIGQITGSGFKIKENSIIREIDIAGYNHFSKEYNHEIS